MAGTRRRIGGCALALFVWASSLPAQVMDDRPEVKKLSPEELERRQADEAFREARTVFGLGVMRHRGDRWLEAVTLLEQAAKMDPQTPAAYRALIPLYLSLAREEDALDACRKVLQLDPADSDTAYQLAKLLKSDGRPRDAIAVLIQGALSKRVDDRPDLLYFMLSDLADLQEKAGDLAAAGASYRRLASHLVDYRARLIGSETLAPEQHVLVTAQALEKVGHCLLQQQKFAEAVKAFERSRDFLAKQTDPELRARSARLNWNLAQACLVQEKWDEALTYLDAYLEHGPVDAEPYEKKVKVLRKLDREASIVPALKKYAARAPDALAVQLVYARELASLPSGRALAEAFYLVLAERFGTADVYRGLFKFYQAADKMQEVLDLLDRAVTTIGSKDEIAADVRERARERGRAMLNVLRTEPGLVNSLLPVVVEELRLPKKRQVETWQFCAALAARARQFDKAEALFRQCLKQAPFQEAAIYSGLLEVLRLQRKHDAMIEVCKEALDGPKKAEATNLILFHSSLAHAYSEKDKIDEALTEADKAIKMSDEAGKVFARCRKAHILARAERYEAAVTECETLLKDLTRANEIKQVRHTLSTIHTLKGDHEKSEAQLLKVLEDDPNDAGANNDLGYQWADRNHNLEQAEKMIRRAIEMDRLGRRDDPELEPDNAAYLDSLGWALFRKGKLDEARDWLEKASALTAGAEDPTVWDHLGDVYFKLKMTNKAKDAWQSAIKLYDHDKRGQKEGRQDEAKRKLKMVTE